MTPDRPIIVAYMGPNLERVILRVRDVLDKDAPTDTVCAYGYLQRVIDGLLGETPLPDYYDAEAVAILEGFVDDLLHHYQILVGELSIIPVHTCALPYLLLEINYGCSG